MDPFDSIDIIEQGLKEIKPIFERQKGIYFDDVQNGYFYDTEELAKTIEKGLTVLSKMTLAEHDFLNETYHSMPTLPHNTEIIENNTFRISVETIDQLPFLAYKITLPYLLPNKRQKRAAVKNAITSAASEAIYRFCVENRIMPFKRSTVVFLSSYDNEGLNVDNDNKESAIITNALIGNFIKDDRASLCNLSFFYRKTKGEAKTEVYISDQQEEKDLFNAIWNRTI